MSHRAAILAVLSGMLLSACTQKMGTEGNLSPDAASPFFGDGSSARMPVPGTVSRDAPPGAPPRRIPFKVNLNLLHRGRERFEIYCTPCHGYTGSADGMIVQRGFTAPPSYHTDRLRQTPDSHIYDVISNGWGAMYSYADRVAPNDRWAIIAYIRVLQFSQNAKAATLPEADRKVLGGEK